MRKSIFSWMISAVNRSIKACYQRGAGLGLLLVFVLAACSGGGEKSHPFEHAGMTMGTTYSVKVSRLPEKIRPDQLKAEIQRVLNDVDATMSTYKDDSELSRFNRSRSTDWFSASEGLIKVIEEAIRVSELSGGAFDVTVGPLVNLWGFGPEHRPDSPPDDETIRQRLKFVGYRHLSVRHSPPAIKKDIPELYADLSAVAKGYGVDRVAEHLESIGIADYLVEVGGELRVKGHNAQNEKWRIAIEKPVPEMRAVEAIVGLEDQGVATSGDYRNYFESEGKRFSHTIDPGTGRPITHTLASVTVLSHTSMHADAIATALMVLGPDKGFELAERERMAVLFIVKSPEGFVEKRTKTFPDYYQVKQ